MWWLPYPAWRNLLIRQVHSASAGDADAEYLARQNQKAERRTGGKEGLKWPAGSWICATCQTISTGNWCVGYTRGQKCPGSYAHTWAGWADDTLPNEEWPNVSSGKRHGRTRTEKKKAALEGDLEDGWTCSRCDAKNG